MVDLVVLEIDWSTCWYVWRLWLLALCLDAAIMLERNIFFEFF